MLICIKIQILELTTTHSKDFFKFSKYFPRIITIDFLHNCQILVIFSLLKIFEIHVHQNTLKFQKILADLMIKIVVKGTAN